MLQFGNASVSMGFLLLNSNKLLATKLREGNVFTRVCHSVGEGGIML